VKELTKTRILLCFMARGERNSSPREQAAAWLERRGLMIENQGLDSALFVVCACGVLRGAARRAAGSAEQFNAIEAHH
jgi:hypothetical protein